MQGVNCIKILFDLNLDPVSEMLQSNGKFLATGGRINRPSDWVYSVENISCSFIFLEQCILLGWDRSLPDLLLGHSGFNWWFSSVPVSYNILTRLKSDPRVII